MLKWALSIHYSYYDKGCDEHEIWNDYYSSSYGRDSSEMAAIFILYRMYAARCFGFESWDYEEMLAELHDHTLGEGWTYGEKKDAEKKTTPLLIPYDELPESEKEYDRNTAFETLKLIVKMGYEIQKKK